MKKYTKPMIIFESFTLSTNIAGDCEFKTNLPNNRSCGVDFSGYYLFMEEMDGCGDFPIDGVENGDPFINLGGNNTICYHVVAGDNLFNS